MKLVTYRVASSSEQRLGAIVGNMVVDLEALGAHFETPLPSTMLELIDLGPVALQRAQELLESRQGRWPVGVALPEENAVLLAPIPRPRKNIFGIGLNYVEHVAESSRSLDTSKDLPDKPVIFSKPPTTVIGPGEAIEHDAELTQQLDWEIELVVILGKRAKRVSVEDAMGYVFGYSAAIDVSARDCRRAGQWIVSKGQDTFFPFGPAIVTADEIEDPHNLNLWLTKNGEIKQSSNTKHMLFKIPALISDLSHCMTLEPGDIISTGTPEGVGAGRNPQEWMWPGDVLVGCVEGIGTIRHPVVKV